MGRMCVFGDSITWGSWDTELGGWVNRLRITTDRLVEAGEVDFSVYNCGISGDRVLDLLNRFDVEAAARRPDHIVLAIGINDSSSEDKTATPLDAFQLQYEALVQKAFQFTRDVAIVGCTNVEERPAQRFYTNQAIAPYNQMISEAAERHGLPFLNPFNLLDRYDLLGDGLHPAPSGHQKLFELVADELCPQWRKH